MKTTRRKGTRAAHAAGLFDGLIVDSFAGGGGASIGIEQAMGRSVDVAVNHDLQAVAMHTLNHPNTRHYCEDVFKVNPLEATGGRPVDLAWFSPDCKHFSRAKGSKPVEKKIRGLAHVVIKWAKLTRPKVIFLENVREFETWGPLVEMVRNGIAVCHADGAPKMVPCPVRKGKTFRLWVGKLRRLGYAVEWRTLDAADYGAPTHRKRLFLVARCDGLPVRWPEPTHGPGRPLPYRTAAECIDWCLPTPSIFLTKEEGRAVRAIRPLAEKTMRRIAMGLKRFVLDHHEPFIVTVNHGGPEFRGQDLRVPMATLTGKHGHGLVTPFLAQRYGEAPHQETRGQHVGEPIRTVTPRANSGVLVVPFLGQHYGDRPDGSVRVGVPASAPLPTVTGRGTQTQLTAAYVTRIGQQGGNGANVQDVDRPLTTVVSKAEHCLTAVSVSQYYGRGVGQTANAPLATVTGHARKAAVLVASLVQYNQEKGSETRGKPLSDPLNTVVTGNRHALVVAFLTKWYGTNVGLDPRRPLPTVTADGTHLGLVQGYCLKYFGDNLGHHPGQPLQTQTSKHRFGIVTVRGVDYRIDDIGLRMLTPRELFRCQGFPDDYQLAPVVGGKPLGVTAQVRMCGNSVAPPVARALVLANMGDVATPIVITLKRRRVAAGVAS